MPDMVRAWEYICKAAPRVPGSHRVHILTSNTKIAILALSLPSSYPHRQPGQADQRSGDMKSPRLQSVVMTVHCHAKLSAQQRQLPSGTDYTQLFRYSPNAGVSVN